MTDVPDRMGRVLWRYFALTYLAVLVHYLPFLVHVPFNGTASVVFSAAVFLSGPFWLMLPVFLPTLLAGRLLTSPKLECVFRRVPRAPQAITWTLAVSGFTLVHLFLYADRMILKLYGFHLNGFVWNLLTTRGGIDSLGAASGTYWSATGIVLVFAALQGGLALLLLVPKVREALPGLFRPRGAAIAASILVGLILFEKGLHGWSRFRWKSSVLTAADAFPLYLKADLTGTAKSMGFKAKPRAMDSIPSEIAKLNYPRVELRRDPSRPRYNVVWMVSESWRWDMLDPEIMPAAHAFAKDSAWFRRHYSGGNGTRTGMFSMFYGLYGPYWFPFLASARGPVLMDVLLKEGYATFLQTSAAFSYPEFDQTIFSRIPRDQLYEAKSEVRYERDRECVGRLVEFLGKQTPDRPFMTFQFFESPHAPYHFPEECAIRKPYAREFNYLATDFDNDVAAVKNRYINSCRHLDTQIARVLEALRERRLLDNTIVVLTGDHGEEFMEKGRWGHNSEFTEEQTRVPLVVRAPGRAAEEVTRLSSHLDIPATVLTLLGVTTPPEEYSLGSDLFGGTARSFTVLSDWDRIGYADMNHKAVFSLKHYSLGPKVTTRDDAPVPDANAFIANHRDWLVRILADLGRFRQ
jgi:membrane-anchored protein YejM (alkaline phosphatase superfamily)